MAENELQKTEDLVKMLTDSKTVLYAYTYICCIVLVDRSLLWLPAGFHALTNIHPDNNLCFGSRCSEMSSVAFPAVLSMNNTYSPVLLLCRSTNSWQQSWMVQRLT